MPTTAELLQEWSAKYVSFGAICDDAPCGYDLPCPLGRNPEDCQDCDAGPFWCAECEAPPKSDDDETRGYGLTPQAALEAMAQKYGREANANGVAHAGT